MLCVKCRMNREHGFRVLRGKEKEWWCFYCFRGLLEIKEAP